MLLHRSSFRTFISSSENKYTKYKLENNVFLLKMAFLLSPFGALELPSLGNRTKKNRFVCPTPTEFTN